MDNREHWKDVDPSYRPGVPMEKRPPSPAKGADVADTHARQEATVPILMHRLRKELPPVFGTAAPPKGLSGLLRVWAYKYPDHLSRRWMILLFADRVDVVEHLVVRGAHRLAPSAVLSAARATARALRGPQPARP